MSKNELPKKNIFVTLGGPKDPKTITRVVDLGEGRGPREWVGGGEMPPWVGKEG